MTIKNRFAHLALSAGLGLALALAGCAPRPESISAEVTATPTLASTPTLDVGPTPLPIPTLIPTPAATLASVNKDTALVEPGIAMNPQTGEPKDIVMVTGTGWPPNAPVSLYWGPPDGPNGRLYWKLTADVSGAFSVGLIVPPRAEWPTYLPPEFTILQLRATTPSIIGKYYWANFTYVPRPTAVIIVARTPTATVTCPTCW